MGVGPFEVATPGTVFSRPPPIDFGNLGLEVANAQNLAKQIEMQQSEAGRSFGVPLSPGEDDPGTYEKTVYSNQGDVNLDDPEGDPEGDPEEDPESGEEAYRALFGEKSGLVDDYADHTADAVAAGKITWDEAYGLLNNHNYVIARDGTLVVARGHLDPGGYAGTHIDDAPGVLLGKGLELSLIHI